MTGIERLSEVVRELGRFSFCYDLYETLGNIADQIERETEERSARLYDMRLGEETDVCELFGVEPVDDPLTSLRRHVESLNDTIENLRLELGEARDDAAWVREHGGLGAVKRRWECLSFYAEPVPRSYAERSIASRQRQIDESHAALRRRNERIAELERELDELDDICDGMSVKDTLEEALNLCATIGCEPSSAVGEELIWALGECTDIVSKRLMPEGMEWMLWDDGRPVTYDDAPDDVVGVYLALDGSGYALMTDLPAQLMSEPSERVKRPAKVLDADGVEIREGDEVWTDYGDGPWTVTSITTDHAWHVHGESDELGSLDMPPSTLTHRAPVLAADGKPLREGETVYHVNSGIEYSVRSVTNGGAHLSKGDKSGGYCQADYLTHERPVVDTWERLEEDADALAEAEINGEGSFNTANDYCTRHGLKDGTVWVLVAQDLVRRAKALAERDAK